VLIEKRDKNSRLIRSQKVPISYGPREKFLTRVNQDPNFTREFSVILPRMGFEIVDMAFDPSRKLNKLNRITNCTTSDKSKITTAYAPIPYNFQMQLSIMSKYIEDANQIVEQILPFFTPDFTPTVNLVPELNFSPDIPIILNNHSVDDSYEGDMITRRTIIHTLDFTMKGYFVGPTKDSKVIKLANTNVTVPPEGVTVTTANSTNSDKVSHVFTRPGLTANGQPTANLSNSVAVTEIDAGDDFGYINQVVIDE
jgi:hypothetical protein